MNRSTALAFAFAVALGLELAPAVAAAGDEEFYADDEPTSLREVRVGAGGVRIANVDGVAPSFEVGADLAPWGDRIGLRMTLGTAMRFGWGTVGYLAPELVLRPSDRYRKIAPFLTAGLQVGVVSITPEARGAPTPGTTTAALGVEPQPSEEPVLKPGPSPLRLTVGPEATAGLRIPLGTAGVEVAGRLSLVHFERTFYPSFALLVTLLGPSQF